MHTSSKQSANSRMFLILIVERTKLELSAFNPDQCDKNHCMHVTQWRCHMVFPSNTFSEESSHWLMSSMSCCNEHGAIASCLRGKGPMVLHPGTAFQLCQSIWASCCSSADQKPIPCQLSRSERCLALLSKVLPKHTATLELIMLSSVVQYNALQLALGQSALAERVMQLRIRPASLYTTYSAIGHHPCLAVQACLHRAACLFPACAAWTGRCLTFYPETYAWSCS